MKKFVLAALMAFGGANASQANDSNWDFGGFIYLWGASLGGTTVTGQSFEMSFSDVLDKLDFALMGALEARNGPVSLLGDFQFLNLAEGLNASVGPGFPATADARVKGLVFTGTVGYDFVDTGLNRSTGFGGFRTMSLDTTVNIAVAGGSRRVSETMTNWDAIIGLRGRNQFAERWAFTYYGDIGTGESDLTWQLSAGFDYRINNWDLSFGYRHMTWDISNSAAVSDMTFSGPYIGAKFRF